MAVTQAQVDAVIALILSGQFDQASAMFREKWDELFLRAFMDVLSNGAGFPSLLVNSGISESWDLSSEAASSFGKFETILLATPDIDQAAIILPVTGSTFDPPDGYRFTIKNADLTTNRLQIDPSGSVTIDGSTTVDIAIGSSLQLFFDGTNYWII